MPSSANSRLIPVMLNIRMRTAPRKIVIGGGRVYYDFPLAKDFDIDGARLSTLPEIASDRC